MPDGRHPERDRFRLLIHRLRWWIALACFFLLLLVILPFGIRWGLTEALQDMGASEVRIENVDFNPFSARLLVEGLASEGQGGQRIEAQHLLVNLDWLPLLKKRLQIRRIELTGARFDLEVRESGAVLVGGLALPETASEPQEAAAQDASEPWGIRMLALHLEDLVLNYRDPKIAQSFRLEQLQLGDLASWMPHQQTPVDLHLQLAEGAVTVSGQSRPFHAERLVELRIRVQDLALGWLSPLLAEGGLQSAQARLGLDLELKMRLGAEVPVVNLAGEISLSGLRAKLLSPPLEIAGDSLRLRGEVQAGEQGKTGLSGLGAKGALELSGVSVEDPRQKLDLMRLGSLRVEEAEFSGEGDLRIARIGFETLALLERQGFEAGEESHNLRLKSLDITPVRSDLRNLELGEIRLSGADIRLHRSASGDLALLSRLPRQAEKEVPEALAETSPAVETDDGKGAALPSLKLGRLTLGGDSRLRFTDASVSPPFELVLNPLELSFGPLDTGGKAPSEFDLGLGIGGYGRLDLEGQAALMAQKPTLHVDGELKGLDLPPFSPYVAKALDYRIRQGHLGTGIRVDVNGGELDGLVELHLDRFELSAGQSQAGKGPLSGALGMSVDTALSLLRDRQGRIELAIPVQGDLDKPDVDLESLLLQATAAAVKKAAVGQFAGLGVTLLTGVVLPPGTLFVAGKMVEYATSLRFDPLIYEPLEVRLDAGQQQTLQTLGDALKKRPETRLVLCGRSAKPDLEALRRQKAPSPSGAAGEGKTPPVGEAEAAALRQLAEKRALGIKDFLVEAQVAAERVLICTPSYDSEGMPRVEMSL